MLLWRFTSYFVEEFGLSALHYAAWNGHVRCIEVLCTNDIGRDRAGQQQSCINLKSCKGYTALHLAASEGVNGGFGSPLRRGQIPRFDLIPKSTWPARNN